MGELVNDLKGGGSPLLSKPTPPLLRSLEALGSVRRVF